MFFLYESEVKSNWIW